MEPSVKRQNSTSIPEDRISKLPDAILCHILSKLPPKPAIGTAILATRWKKLFPQIPNLEIILDDSDLINPDTPVENLKDSFIRFLYNLMTTLDEVPYVQKFDLSLEQNYDHNDVNALLSTVLRMNLSVLRVTFPTGHMGSSLDSIFSSETLKEIYLAHVNVQNVLRESVFPKLKDMRLWNVTFSKGGLLERSISACPLLEYLTINTCRIKEHVSVLHIESTTIKNLRLIKISDCYNDGIYDVVLDMPSLESVTHHDHLPEAYHVNNFNRIHSASIDIRPSYKQCWNYEIFEMRHKLQNVYTFVKACSRATSLSLTRQTVMGLAWSSGQLPTFPNLINLYLGQIDSLGWRLLPKFLDSAPNLQVLNFKGGFSECKRCYVEFQNNVPEHVPRCLNLHLHRIKFEDFNGEDDELQLVEYFVRFTKSLAKIKFGFCSSLSSQSIRCTKSKLWSLRSNSKKYMVDFSFKIHN